jgi:UDPglucose 6-dehydrogenase
MIGKKIAVAGAGYVGLSIGVLLARSNRVVVVCTTEAKAAIINSGKSPIVDKEISRYLREEPLFLTATTNQNEAYTDADLVIVATPTNFEPLSGCFDTSSVENVISLVSEVNSSATIVIKSTVPVGFTDFICRSYPERKILFSPEFLREGRALFDNLHPSRVVVGSAGNDESNQKAHEFAQLLLQESLDEKVPVLITPNTEAECIKLFANTYLALRVAFFNELDMYTETMDLDSRSVIDGICMDPRIGDHYNNPSFGYGGYCLPKDTKQLLANYGQIPNEIIGAIVASNETRKNFIVDRILQKAEVSSENAEFVVGFYRLAMKKGSDNLRASSSQDVMKKMILKGVKVVVYEPILSDTSYDGYIIINDLEEFKKIADIIVVNRMDDGLDDVMSKIYTRDLFCRD